MNIENKNRVIEGMKKTIQSQSNQIKAYEKALEEITRQSSVNRAKEIASKTLGDLTIERRIEIQMT